MTTENTIIISFIGVIFLIGVIIFSIRNIVSKKAIKKNDEKIDLIDMIKSF